MTWLSRSVVPIMLIAGAMLAPYSQAVLATPAPAVANAADTLRVSIDHYFYSVHEEYDGSLPVEGHPEVDLCNGVLDSGQSLSEFSSDQELLIVGSWVQQGVCAQTYETKIQFDLDQLQALPEGSTITTAVLYFSENELNPRDAHGPEPRYDAFSCVKRINAISGEAESGRYRYYPDAYSRTSDNSRSATQAVDLTPAVKKWLSGRWDNFGVGLRSGSDAADATSASKLCVSYLDHVQLDVEYQAPAIADLQVVRLEVHKKSGATGCSSDGTNTLTVVVKNAGTAAPEKPADLAISYSFVSDRVQAITREQAGVLTAGPGGEQRIDFTDLPMGGGDTQVQVTIDKQNAVTLAKHNDPSFSGNISCDTRAADLSIKSAKFNRVDVTGPNVKTACIAGSDNTLEVIVSNLGDKEPGVFYTGILVDGQLVAKASVGSVSPLSEKTSFIGEVNSKITIPEGTHTVQAIVDPEDKIAEANEDNNTLPAVTVTCAAKKP